MRCLIPLMLVLWASGRADAQESDAIVRLREGVEVRSGPTIKYYATGRLRYLDKVRVKAVHGDYLSIAPPVDAFSLVAKASVRLLPGREGVINVETADTYQGSTLVGDVNARGTRLLQGAQVTILEEVSVPTASGQASFYKIVPLNESRYIPADAVREPAVAPAVVPAVVSAGGAAGAAGGVQQASVAPSDQIGRWLDMADLQYKKGVANGDWTEAKRLYEELSRCDNHQARMIAWNRLSFIRKQKPELFTATVGAPSVTSGTSGFRPNTPPVRPAEPMPPPSISSRSAPVSPSPAPPKGATAGWLRRAITRQAGQPAYYVADAQGRVLFHVAPATGADLEPYVDQKIEISGGPLVYRQDLRGNYMLAVSARRVQ